MNPPLLPALVVCVALTACSGSDEPGRGDPLSAVAARAAMDQAGSPSPGSGTGLSFRIGSTIPGPPAEDLGRLASSSWDVYFVLDRGETGSWGAGMDVFDSEAASVEAARKNAAFMACRGKRRPIADFPFGDAEFGEATSCRRASGPGFIATASSADGFVAANLTVGTEDRSSSESALGEVWSSLSTTADDVRDSLPRP